MISVRVKGLVKRFGSYKALNGIDLQIEPGELFFLLGPSGCGKTTLLRCLAGFNTPDEGRLFFGDRDVTGLEPHKRNTGMMFQSYALWPHLTIWDNVAFGLKQQGLNREEVDKRTGEALESIRMLSYAKQKPNQLSGGQQQRIALARALVVRPECLLLDEPLSNLDARLRHEMRSEIRRVCKESHLTTIYVTHDQKEALSIADRMAVMNEGNILQIGTPLEVYKRPRNRFVANFIGDSNFLEGKVLESSGKWVILETRAGRVKGIFSDPAEVAEPGDSVTVSIRPESIRLQSEAPQENGIRGNVVTSVYYGDIAHYRLESSGEALQVAELNPRHVGVDKDTVIYGRVAPEDVVLLKG